MTRIALLGLLALAACSAEPETGPPPGEQPEAMDPYVAPPPPPPPAPLPEPVPEPSPTPTPEPLPDDAQMLDDADATGMTARVDRSGETTDEDIVPVEE